MKTFTFLLLIAISVLFPATGFSQRDSSAKLSIGIEQDLLPYATGGYFAGGWIGKGHLRTRILTAYVHKPDWFIAKGFTNNYVHAYAIVEDYFPKGDWKGFYIGSGLVYWKNSLQTDKKLSTAHFETVLLNGTLGYNYFVSRHLYLSPWAGMHFRIGGAKEVNIDGDTYKPPLLNPEASLKIGWHF